MADKFAARAALLALMAALAACGKTGDLYLPEPAGEVVTRPADAPNSPQTPDAQPAAPAPAPEVSAEEPRKEKGAAPPPK